MEHTSRRALLKGAPVAFVALAVPAGVSATVAVDRKAWKRARAAYDALRAEDAAFSAHYHRTWEACSSECKQVPHVILEPSAHTGKWHVSTADDWYVRRCRSDVAALDAGKMRFDPLPDLQEHERQMRALVEAADTRDGVIQAIRDRYDMEALDDQSDDLGDRLAEAQSIVMDLPAPDLAAVHWKLTQLRDPDGTMVSWSADYVEQTFADVARHMPAAT